MRNIDYTRAGRLFYLGGKQTDFTRRVPGLMGRADAAGYTFTVPGNQGLTYARTICGRATTLVHAWNRAGIAETGDLPIWLDIDSAGRTIIAEARYG
jgi:hypothetical protein